MLERLLNTGFDPSGTVGMAAIQESQTIQGLFDQEPLIRDRTVSFCIAHETPVFKLPEEVNIIQTGDFESPARIFSVAKYLSRIGIQPRSSYLADYAYLLIHDLLARYQQDVDQVIFLLHRKFCSISPLGQTFLRAPHLRLEAAEKLDIAAELRAYQGNTLFPIPITFERGIVSNYASCHHLQDFLRLTALCVDHGILSDQEALEFLTSNTLFPCPAVGSLPIDVSLEIAAVGARYVKAVHDAEFVCLEPSDSYQHRAESFFCERLVSFFLLKSLLKSGIVEADPLGTYRTDPANLGFLIGVYQGDGGEENYHHAKG